ncbi:non-ribosomal peptide synthetase [Streptomyces liangshanensis]|uniref:Amino acid adenylation domain-containing protein n=1 Tax=Streptomyces liangshanensis TaxID=2717324 RepID=A0A6G9GSZ8_9ACTN|nr:non-ribosomal peptide synthetase [Streptomyces liangshanensis]QIQ01320.1 amino acid adenylation domain-containing protein [Streptomyces liangshanensis]
MNARIADVLPLSPVQEGLLFHAARDTGGPDPYLVQARFLIGPAVTADALRAGVAALLDRHPNLRACFRHERLDRPVQVVPKAVRLPWTEVDLTGLGLDDVTARTEEALREDAALRFDLARPPLVRATFLRHDTGAELIVSFHHILLDGWSLPILERDLAALVAGRPLPPPVPYRDYLVWLGGQDQRRADAAWAESLHGLERPALLAPDGPDTAPDRTRIRLSTALTGTLTARAAEEGVTLNTLVQVAWALVLARLTGSRDLVFGAVVSGRPHDLPGVESMVGLFINTLPVRVRLRDGESAGELLRRVQDEQSRLLAHHHARVAEVQRAAGAGELFDSILAFENFPQSPASQDGPDSVRLVDVGDATHYPVTLAVVAEDRLLLSVSCRRGISATGVTRSVVRVLEQLAADPGRSAEDIDALPEAEHDRLLALAAGPSRTVAGPTTLTGGFAAQAARTPDAPAVDADGEILSYARLDAASDRLAGRLVRAGVAPGDTVALLLPRSAAVVVAQLAVLKAGACWLPLDPGQPPERLARLVQAAEPVLALTPRASSVRLPADLAVLDIEEDGSVPRDFAGPPAHPESAACVIYTSGSTGEPKGVVVPQRAITELAADGRFAGGAHRRVLFHNPYTFDASTYEVWVPLLNGGTVVVAPAEAVTPDLLKRVVPDRRVTALMLTPELLRTVAEIAPDALAGLSEVWAGGDVLAADTVRRVQEHCPGAVVVNGYGPTETTVFATAHTAHPTHPTHTAYLTHTAHTAHAPRPTADPVHTDTPADPGTVPIGRPLDNTRAHVLDAALRPMPAGATGELYLAGTGLAHGYLGRPAATAERFVADPYGPPGSRMYRTGDLARRTAGGVLEFAGRADDQVKVRGFRVEPAEVEVALAGCPGVARAVVGARCDAAGGKLLAAWLLLDEAGPESAEADTRDDRWNRTLARAREHAARHLPAHLVPSLWARVDHIPLTRHHKVDRAALPAPGPTGGRVTERAPRTARERELCALFGTVLGLPAVGPDTDFFTAGGHSLTALRLRSKIETVLDVRIPVSVLFDAPTPAALAARLDAPPAAAGRAPRIPLRSARRRTGPAAGSDDPSGNSLEPVLTLRAGGDRVPLFCVHPGLGLGWSFANLLPYLDPARPVHTLQSPALLTGVDRLPPSMGAMADLYVARLRAVRPHGPYLLLGRSFGGALAHEMAVRLRRAGEEVGMLAVVDAMPMPDTILGTPLDPVAVEDELLHILLQSHAPDLPVPPGPLDRARVFATVRRGGLDALTDPLLHTLVDAGTHHTRLVRNWSPTPYEGRVTLFSATRDTWPTPAEKKAAWHRVSAALDVHDLDCGHGHVLTPGPAAEIAAVLETALRGD